MSFHFYFVKHFYGELLQRFYEFLWAFFGEQLIIKNLYTNIQVWIKIYAQYNFKVFFLTYLLMYLIFDGMERTCKLTSIFIISIQFNCMFFSKTSDIVQTKKTNEWSVKKFVYFYEWKHHLNINITYPWKPQIIKIELKSSNKKYMKLRKKISFKLFLPIFECFAFLCMQYFLGNE